MGSRAVTLDTPLVFRSAHLSRFTGLSARRLVRRSPGAAQWCAENLPTPIGVACAIALARVIADVEVTP